jgi:hypothetical protein
MGENLLLAVETTKPVKGQLTGARKKKSSIKSEGFTV